LHLSFDQIKLPMRLVKTTVALLVLSFSQFAAPMQAESPSNSPWPSWRGPNGNGTAASGKYPTEWSSSEGIRWKLDLPGRGASSPIVVDQQILFTLGNEGVNTLWSVDMSGKKNWEAVFGKAVAGKNAKASEANSSPITDGKNVFVYFKSGDVGCASMDGTKVWSLNLQEKYGENTLWWDLGTSPILTNDALVIAVMHSGPSFLVALDKKTGNELWKSDRWLDVNQESNQSYTTPVLHGDTIITVGADHITSHHSKDGKELWRVGGLNPKNDPYFRSISSPVVIGELAICPYARGNSLTAVHLAPSVEPSKRVAWSIALGSDVPTPTVRGDSIYTLGDKGLVSCLRAKDGSVVWQEQLPKSNRAFSSSPILAGDHLYCVREDATTFVIDVSGEAGKVISQNKLDGQAVATPVFINNRIYLRTFEALYCIE
jgi:hypothetical protein